MRQYFINEDESAVVVHETNDNSFVLFKSKTVPQTENKEGKKDGRGKGIPHCRKCGKKGHRSNHCPN